MKQLAGIGFGIVFLSIFFLTTDLSNMISSIKEANYYYFAPGILGYFISLLIRTYRWKLLLKPTKVVPTKRLFPVVIVGYMANNVLPFRIGELIRSFFLYKRERINTATGLTTIFVERLMDAISLLLLIGVSAVFIPLPDTVTALSKTMDINENLLISIFVLPFAGMFIMVILAAIFRKRTEFLIRLAISPLPSRVARKSYDVAVKLLDGFEALREKRILFGTLLLSIPIWLCESVLFYFIIMSLGINTYIDNTSSMIAGSVLVTGITNIGSSVPAAPGGIGLFEVIARETLVLIPKFSIPRSEAAAFAAVTHLCLLIPVTLLGQILLWFNGSSILSVAKDIKDSDESLTSNCTEVNK